MISQRARYAFKALFALARIASGESLQIRVIAQQDAIPRSFLEHIMLDLKRHGLVASRRGRDGGYFLLVSPDKISLGMVLRLIDGPIVSLPCLATYDAKRCPDCLNEASCALRHAFADVHDTILKVVDRTSLADAMERAMQVHDGLAVYGAHPFSGADI